ncbi:endonuclease/exonuclease/phosphatase family protein [Reichenbachiella ulvae]|uniref:Endonuclease/exonuclease/phosphatase family protein n=1 Tax=Reichenbachiella ulvae TaxID=2980104 RepID=A0ABT3CPF1_9BACT|nr:endonuclease/exonuclease/phosphatase family protein [Reichenbachiella ulvae]MCV9385566.1 endonuclease/exonuclease/phosphatase family protein [Reichenbachiella ulvae]
MKKLSCITLFLLAIMLLVRFHSVAQNRAMTYNIRYATTNDQENQWDNRKAELCELLNYYRPGFIGLQESLPIQNEYIDEQLPSYKYIGFGREGEGSNSESAPIFYDSTLYQLLDQEVFWLSPTPSQISIGWDASYKRVATIGIFRDLNSRDTLFVINTHFDHMGQIAREKSASLLLTKIQALKTESKSLILMGDFNSLPSDTPIQILTQKLEDTYTSSLSKPYGPVGTFNGFDSQLIPSQRIDYIFGKNLKVLSYRAVNDKRSNGLCISDHLPVLIEWEQSQKLK